MAAAANPLRRSISLPDIIGNGAGARASSDLDIAGQEAQHPLLTEAPVERPDGLGMRGGFVGALGGRAIGKQDQRANDLIAPLELISQPQRQLGRTLHRVHRPLLLSVGWEKGVCITLYGLCHCEEHEGTLCEVVRTQSAALRIYVKETVSRFGRCRFGTC